MDFLKHKKQYFVLIDESGTLPDVRDRFVTITGVGLREMKKGKNLISQRIDIMGNCLNSLAEPAVIITQRGLILPAFLLPFHGPQAHEDIIFKAKQGLNLLYQLGFSKGRPAAGQNKQGPHERKKTGHRVDQARGQQLYPGHGFKIHLAQPEKTGLDFAFTLEPERLELYHQISKDIRSEQDMMNFAEVEKLDGKGIQGTVHIFFAHDQGRCKAIILEAAAKPDQEIKKGDALSLHENKRIDIRDRRLKIGRQYAADHIDGLHPDRRIFPDFCGKCMHRPGYVLNKLFGCQGGCCHQDNRY